MKITTCAMIHRLTEISAGLPEAHSSKRNGLRIPHKVIDEILGFHDQGLPRAEIIKVLGIAPSTFLRWSKRQRPKACEGFRNIAVTTDAHHIATSRAIPTKTKEARIVLGSGCTMYVDIDALDTELLNRLRGL